MQTISIHYRSSDKDRDFMEECRRVFSAAVRTAYANALDEQGIPLKQKALRELVKRRFAGDVVDAWTLHCATLEGMDLHKRIPDGSMVFGGKATLLRRSKGLIGKDAVRRARLRPLTSRGDNTKFGNRHFRLSLDARTCVFRMYGRMIELRLPQMKGNAGEVLRRAAALAAAKKINITFRIDDKNLQVVIDPADLPDHPERRSRIKAVSGRAVGIDLNPSWIGMTAVENFGDVRQLAETKVLDTRLVKLDHSSEAPAEVVREVLAGTCDAAIALARQWGAGVITVERGLGKLRSAGPSRKTNRLLNYWARTLLLGMLRRKAALAGIKVIEVWGGYSTTIGNLWFDLPDACASAAEIARRGLAARAKIKDLFPVYDEGWRARRGKDVPLPAEVVGWIEVHRGLKAAKTFGYRRPHPPFEADPGSQAGRPGLAVRRLCRRRRPGLIARAIGTCRPARVNPVIGERSSGPPESERIPHGNPDSRRSDGRKRGIGHDKYRR